MAAAVPKAIELSADHPHTESDKLELRERSASCFDSTYEDNRAGAGAGVLLLMIRTKRIATRLVMPATTMVANVMVILSACGAWIDDVDDDDDDGDGRDGADDYDDDDGEAANYDCEGYNANNYKRSPTVLSSLSL